MASAIILINRKVGDKAMELYIVQMVLSTFKAIGVRVKEMATELNITAMGADMKENMYTRHKSWSHDSHQYLTDIIKS